MCLLGHGDEKREAMRANRESCENAARNRVAHGRLSCHVVPVHATQYRCIALAKGMSGTPSSSVWAVGPHAFLLAARNSRTRFCKGAVIMAQITQHGEQMVHIRFEGQSWELAASALGLGNAADANAVKQAVARFLEVPLERLADYYVEFHETGGITIRPHAVFG
jgi:hypothetical protein